jgi:hypothetical protein
MAIAPIGAVVPLQLDREVVRSVFPVDQRDPLPALAALPDLVWRWNYLAQAGTPVSLAYAFSSSAPGYDPGPNLLDPSSFRGFTEAQRALVAQVLETFAAVAAVQFRLVADARDADLVFRQAELATSGFAYFPPYADALQPTAEAGDIFLDVDFAGDAYIVFHEVGHALGVAHPYEGDRPHPEDYGLEGGRHLSVVDERPVPKPYVVFANGAGYTLTTVHAAVTPMPLDILALQLLYGPNLETAAGDTVYRFDVDPVFYRTIWDGGGVDTIDLSNQSNPSLVSLVEGSYSTVGLRDPFAGLPQSTVGWALGIVGDAGEFADGSDVLAIAFGTVIENAIGGAAGDRLIGNAADNRLQGNGGDDTLTGGAGDDRLVFSATGNGIDTITDFAPGDVIVVTGAVLDGRGAAAGDGSTLLAGGVQLSFEDGVTTILVGTDAQPGADVVIRVPGLVESRDLEIGADTVRFAKVVDPPLPETIVGTDAADLLLVAGAGGAFVDALGGDDTIAGGPGNDTVDGGAGIDRAVWAGPAAGHRLVFTDEGLRVEDTTGASGTDVLRGVERLVFADREVIVETMPHGSYADLPESLYHFFIVAFGAAPGVSYLDQLAEAYRHGLSVREIVEVFTSKPQFTETYPASLAHAELAQRLVAGIVKDSASAVAAQEATADVAGALGLGWTVGEVIYTVFGNLAAKPFDDPAWGGTARQFANQIAVARHYTEMLDQGTTDLDTLRAVLAPVDRHSDVATGEAIATLIGVALL